MTIEQIIKETYETFDVSQDFIHTKTRRGGNREIVMPRQVSAYLINKYFGYDKHTLKGMQAGEIGKIMGVDRTSIYYYVKTVSGLNKYDFEIREKIKQIETKINSL
jgi:chromosomal replication initiation ATPase DnaA